MAGEEADREELLTPDDELEQAPFLKDIEEELGAIEPEAAEEAVSLFQKQKGNPIEWDWLGALWDWLRAIWNKLWAIASEAAAAIWEWVGSWLTSTWEWVMSVATSVGELFTYVWDTVSDVVSSWVTKVWDWLESLWLKVSDRFTSLGSQIANYFSGMPEVITSTLADPITDWLSGFIENIRSLFIGVAEGVKKWLQEYWTWLLPMLGGPVLFGVITGVHALAEYGGILASNMIESLIGYIQKVGRVDPTNAPSVAGGLMSIVGVGVVGLAAMTIGGELMHPLKEIGMGHVSAMIGDVVNYKVVSGAFMAALVGAALATPLRYYFNYMLRPWLPGAGEIAEAMSRDLFIDPDSLNPDMAPGIRELMGPTPGVDFEKRLLAYRGFHDEYYPLFKELSNTRIGYFALAGIAREGTFDETMFTSELMRAGYWSRTRPLLLDMYRHQAQAATKELYAAVPMTALKEGWIDEPRLVTDLTRLGVPEDKLPRYIDAAWLLYEFDYKSDLLASLKDAYRKGLVTDDEFTASLTGWGMVSERAAEHLHREQIRRYGKT